MIDFGGMKMKLKASIFASLFVAPLLATPVTSANTFGIVKVDSGHTVTIISVPWVECGTGSAIKVVDLITKTGINDNDYLYYWDAGVLKGFYYNNSAKNWAPLNVAEEAGATAGDINATVTRGTAIVFVRNTSTESPFYVYGQVGTTGETSTISNGKNVLASPKAEALAIGGDNWTGNAEKVHAGDKIMIPLTGGAMKVYTAGVKGAAVTWYDDKLDVTADAIPAGEGFWYIHNGDSVTINW